MVSCRWLAVTSLVWVFAGSFGATAAFADEAEAAALERLKFLHAEVARHDELYFKKAAPEISDSEYDRLKRELDALRERVSGEGAELAGQAAGLGDDRVAGFPKHRHRAPMLSLDKAYTEEALRKFGADLPGFPGEAVAFVVEPKFDGLAISATYERGRLVKLATRGNGAEGDDITANADLLPTLPRTLNKANGQEWPTLIEVRGEVFMTHAEFARLNRMREEAGEPPHASPRNLAAGTLKSMDRNEATPRRLETVMFGVGGVEPASALPESQTLLRARFMAWGLPTADWVEPANSLDGVWRAVREFERTRADLPYPVDGVVVKIDSLARQRALGESNDAPRWAIAYKFSSQRATTRLNAITIQVGRTGLLTPVAELESVRIGGALIARASLHNADTIRRLDLRIGDQVIVERSGTVIPGVLGVELSKRSAESQPYVFPSVCPACGEAAVKAAGGKAWHCVNASCPAQMKRRLLHFASAVGIEGLGGSTIDALVTGAKLRRFEDFYELQRDDLIVVGNVGSGEAGAILRSLEASKRVALWRFVWGFGIRGVGEARAKILAERFQNLAALVSATEGELRGLAGFNDATVMSVRSYFKSNERLVDRLRASGVEPLVAPPQVK